MSEEFDLSNPRHERLHFALALTLVEFDRPRCELEAALGQAALLALGPAGMDTAPRDGTMILVYGRLRGREVYDWHKACWTGDCPGDNRRYWRAPSPGVISAVIEPWAWAPLPPIPAPPSQAAERSTSG